MAKAATNRSPKAAKKAVKPTPAKKASGKSAAKKATPKKAAAPKKSAVKKTVKSAPAKKTSKAPKAAKATSKIAKKPAAAKAPKKASPAKKGSAPRRDVDVKSASLGRSPRKAQKSGKSGGGGLSFLLGKPGSSGEVDQAAVDGPRLTKTKLTAKELRTFRDLLLDKRRQLLGDVDSLENEALRVEQSNLSHLPMHMADQGTDNYEQEFTLSLADRDRRLIADVDAALAKIDDKTYGICEGTGQMIAKTRLEAQPTARYSIEYAKTHKRTGILRP